MALTVQMLIEKLIYWIRRGFVDSQVWQDIQELVNFDLPTAVTPPCEKPAQRSTSDAQGLSCSRM